MTKEETFYVISYVQDFLTDEYYKPEDEKSIVKKVRAYRRDMTKLDKYKHSNETQDIFEAQRYKTEKDARMALDRMSKCVYNSDYRIHCVTIKTEVTSIIDVSEE